VTWFNKPRFLIDFEGGTSNIVHAEHERDSKPGAFIYVRARVRNVGRHTAKGCRVFLRKLEEVLPGGQTLQTTWDDSKVLAWAGWSFVPVDVPAGVEFYVDIVRVSKADRGWLFSVEKLFATQQGLKDYVGTYRFHLMATAENASPAYCTIDVVYNGDWHSLRSVAVKPA
jgi:hypothetical protein